MNLRPSILYLFPFLMVLSACDIFQTKETMPGKRETVFDTFYMQDTGTRNQAATLPSTAPVVNQNWAVPGGSLSHTLPALKLGTELQKAWAMRIGQGNSAEQRLVSNLIIAEKTIYGMDARGRVSALDLGTGRLLWSHATSPETREDETLGGGIAYANRTLFVTTSFGEVLALSAKDGGVQWKQHVLTPIRIAPTVQGNRLFIVNISNELIALHAHNGERVWSHSGLPESTGLLGGGVPAISDNMIVTPYSSGEVYALRTENGYPVWTDTFPPRMTLDSLSSITHIRARPVIFDQVAYIISHGGYTAAIDLNTGIRLWQKEISGIRTPAVYGNYLFLVTNHRELVCLNRHTGQTVWTINLPEQSEKVIWSGPVLANSTLILTGSNGYIRFHDAQSGKFVKDIHVAEPMSLSPVVIDSTLLVLTDHGNIIAYR